MSVEPQRRLIVLRHGQTEWNQQGRYQGRTDTALCASGLLQARAAGLALRQRCASVLITSPLQRARATAEAVCWSLGAVPCETDERLIELGFGDWEGLTQAQVKRRWPALLRVWKQAPHEFRFPGGERLDDGLSRLQDFLRHPPRAAATAPCCIIAVTHSAPIRLAKLFAEGRPLSQYRQMPLPPHDAALEFDWDPTGRLRPIGMYPLT
jgi:broad specificity phosphatase PhoE